LDRGAGLKTRRLFKRDVREAGEVSEAAQRIRKRVFTLKNTSKHAKNGAKTRIRDRFYAFMRNSLPTRALIREILYSCLSLKCAILCNMSQKIAKLRTNVGEPNGRFHANIWLFSAA
jgi:hypothetical protein